ncbi:MAG: hypothetical protein WC994_07390 [Brumimicrobium sp.]
MKLNRMLIIGLGAMFLFSCHREGCTDYTALNYDSKAKNDNGTCIYNDGSGPGGGGPGGGGGGTLPIQITNSFSGTTLEDQTSNTGVADYYVQGTWTISDATIIKPGVRIMMKAGSKIYIDANGSLDATGTLTNPIEIFGEQPTKGFWNGVSFNSNNLNNRLIYCTVSDGADVSWAEPGMISLNGNAQVVIQNSQFYNGDSYGIALDDVTCKLPNFQNNYFNNFKEEPIRVEALHQCNFIDNSISFGSNNNKNRVYVEGANYTENTIVSAFGVPYFIATSFEINGGVTSVNAGVEFIMAANTNINVGTSGALTTNGTAGNRVIFRGEQPTKGFWRNLVFSSNNTNNDISYTDVRDGSEVWNTPASVYIATNARLAMDNVHVSNSSSAALGAHTTATFVDNGGNSWSNCDGGGGVLP